MKYIGMAALIILLNISTLACASSNLNVLKLVEPRETASGITINRTAHPIVLPLETHSGATFAVSDGELIFYGDNKGLYASVVTSEAWNSPLIQMNLIPEYIFNRDLSAIPDTEFRKELEGIIRITIGPVGEKTLSVMSIDNMTVYIAYTPEKSIIMISSPDKPDLFTRVILNKFSWEEIENDILKGIKER